MQCKMQRKMQRDKTQLNATKCDEMKRNESKIDKSQRSTMK